MLNPIKPKKAYELVIDQIQNMILKGELKKGQKLPSERDLAAQLQISRPTVRESLRALEVIGLIESRHGEGHFVNSSFSNGLVKPLSLVFILEDSNTNEILELRKTVEYKTAFLAAKMRTDDDIRKLEEIISEFKLKINEEKLPELDTAFHAIIAEASKNQLIISVFNAMSILLERFMKDAHRKGIEKFITKKSNKEYVLLQHSKIYEAIKNGDEKAAGESMLEHLQFIESIKANLQ